MSEQKPKIVFIGAGIVGGAAAAWVADKHDEVYVLDQPAVNAVIREQGISVYVVGQKDAMLTTKVKVIDHLGEVPDADYVVIAVKNFHLPAVAKMVKDTLGDKPVIVSMANGIDNQRVLPELFSKVIYCVVAFNGIMDEPLVIQVHQHGPLIIGTLDNSLQDQMQKLARVMNPGVPTIVTDNLQDTVHCKVIINLVNSLATLIGFGVDEIDEPDLFQKILSQLLYEGMLVMQANGYKECKKGGMPPWIKFKAAVKLPTFLTRGMFKRNIGQMLMPSMAQDVLLKGMRDTELESINGYLIELADKAGLTVPYNRAIYELAQEELAKEDFKPVGVKAVWERIQKELSS